MSLRKKIKKKKIWCIHPVVLLRVDGNIVITTEIYCCFVSNVLSTAGKTLPRISSFVIEYPASIDPIIFTDFLSK